MRGIENDEAREEQQVKVKSHNITVRVRCDMGSNAVDVWGIRKYLYVCAVSQERKVQVQEKSHNKKIF